jgi:hypothetical protein
VPEELGDVVHLDEASKGAKSILGKNINDLTEAPKGYQFFYRGKEKYIRRIDAKNNSKRLTVDDEGKIIEFKGSQRVSKPGKLRKNLGDPPGRNHEAHHLVSDNVVRKSPLHKEAMKRDIYDVDRKGNGKYLAKTDADAIAGKTKDLPLHSGSHSKYDIKINEAIDEVLRANNVDIKNIGKLTDKQLTDMINDVEEMSLDILENWKGAKLY